ncbi:MAG TPA: RNA polymerase sigma factor [Prolixibacteraceae bacterium]|nr:RNA polymerase sigma factor [Prolixibacteraceae bacterium]
MTLKEYNQSVDLFADPIFRFVAKNVKDHHFAEDIVQDCYEKLWKNLDQVNGEKVKAYLFTTAYHTMIDRLRKEKKVSLTGELPVSMVGTSEQYSDLGERLQEAVNRLPEIQKAVITLRDYEGYSYQEIGEITGLNESQVKVYIYRARIFLKNYIGATDVLV